MKGKGNIQGGREFGILREEMRKKFGTTYFLSIFNIDFCLFIFANDLVACSSTAIVSVRDTIYKRYLLRG